MAGLANFEGLCGWWHGEDAADIIRAIGVLCPSVAKVNFVSFPSDATLAAARRLAQ